MTLALLEQPCHVRWQLNAGSSEWLEVDRQNMSRRLYGAPVDDTAYVWPETSERYIVAIAAETQRDVRGRTFGCFHVFPTMDAAIMYALSVGESV